MAEISKKISFGFTKSKTGTKVSTVKKCTKTPGSVQYITCLDSNAIVVKSTNSEQPMSGDLEENSSNDVRVPALEKPSAVNNAMPTGGYSQVDIPQTLEQRAAEELLRDAKNFDSREQTEVSQSLILQIARAKNRVDSEVSTPEDYEQVPVENFGLALLRGMGWDSTRGIGKTPQVVSAVRQVLRPKGVGLGADKKNSPLGNVHASGHNKEELKVKVGACLKILCGIHKDKYGKILGFNEESGRLIVELSCGGANVSVNESAVQLVTKEHYSKNCRIINAAQYESYMRNNEMEHNDSDRKSQKRKHESR